MANDTGDGGDVGGRDERLHADPFGEHSSTDVDPATLPAWWREAQAEFSSHDLGQYRPPRFADGVLKYAVVDRLEDALDVRIRFRAREEAATSNRWTVLVDGQEVCTVPYRRHTDGYSVFVIESERFECVVREAVSSDETR